MITLAILIAGGFLLPPKVYDHFPRIPFSVVSVEPRMFRATCPVEIKNKLVVSCTWGNTIFLRSNLSRSAWRVVLRHEEAHINGWPADHPKAHQLL